MRNKRAARRTKNCAADLIEDTIDDVNVLVNDLRKRTAGVADQGVDLSGKAKKEIMAALEQGQKAIARQRQKFTETFGP